MKKHKRFSTEHCLIRGPSGSLQLSTDSRSRGCFPALSLEQPNKSTNKLSPGKMSSYICMPVESLIQPFSISKPLEMAIPSRNNLKNLNDFLKQQVFLVQHKERVISNIGYSRSNQFEKVKNLKSKILNMINLKVNHSGFIPEETTFQSPQKVNLIDLPSILSTQIIKSIKPSHNTQERKLFSSIDKKHQHLRKKKDLSMLNKGFNQQNVPNKYMEANFFVKPKKKTFLTVPEKQKAKRNKERLLFKKKDVNDSLSLSKISIEFVTDSIHKDKGHQ